MLAAVFVAEIGDVSRFKSARHLCSWAGLTPTHHESDEKVRRGHITKQGSRLVRWAAVEAVAHQHGATSVRVHHHRVAERRGNKIGRVAAARKLLTLVYYGLRDGEIRCLARVGVRPGTDATRCELGAFHGSRSAARPSIRLSPPGCGRSTPRRSSDEKMNGARVLGSPASSPGTGDGRTRSRLGSTREPTMKPWRASSSMVGQHN